MISITQSDPVTTHDFRPTHARRPAWVLDARAVAETAWKQHDEAIEAYLAGELDQAAVQAAGEAAAAAQAYADDMLGYWLSGYEPESVARSGAVSVDITVAL